MMEHYQEVIQMQVVHKIIDHVVVAQVERWHIIEHVCRMAQV